MADFTIGDYSYTIIDSTNKYVRVQTAIKTKSTYATIPASIINNNITYLVVDMLNCYQDCTSLTTGMSIPQDVTNLYQCFQRCTNLQSINAIPSGVINMEYCFQNCTNLTGTIHVYNNPTNYTNIFSGTTKPIYIVPHGSAVKSKWQTIAASYSNVTVLDEPAIDIYHNTANNKDVITFGGYEETTSKDKVVSYLDLLCRSDVYIQENTELLNSIQDLRWINDTFLCTTTTAIQAGTTSGFTLTLAHTPITGSELSVRIYLTETVDGVETETKIESVTIVAGQSYTGSYFTYNGSTNFTVSNATKIYVTYVYNE